MKKESTAGMPAEDVREAYEKYANMLYRIALSELFSKQDAEDALQDVFEKYLVKAPVFADETHEKAWFIRVTINKCHDHVRRQKIRSYTQLDEIAELVAGQSQLEQAEQISILTHLSNIPEKNRKVITLHYLEGFSVEETAAILKLSVSAVKMRLQRGRENLKNKLNEEERHV